MKNSTRLLLVLATLVLLVSAAIAAPRPPVKAAAGTNHGTELKGTIVSLDEKARVATIKDAAGKSLPVEWTAATSVTGGTLKANEQVTVRYMSKGGKNVAASMAITPATPAAASHKLAHK